MDDQERDDRVRTAPLAPSVIDCSPRSETCSSISQASRTDRINPSRHGAPASADERSCFVELWTPGHVRQQRIVNQSSPGRLRNRIGWAASSLTRAEALVRPRRGTYTITDLGQRLLVGHPEGFGEVELRQIPAYRDHVPATRAAVTVAGANAPRDRSTPRLIRWNRSTQAWLGYAPRLPHS